MGRAIVREPQAFLMDEPLSNLDAKLRVGMRAQLAALHARLGTTTVYVTHDQTEAMTLGRRVAVMRDGRVQQIDAPQVLYHEPVNLFVAAFIGSPAMNLIDATIDGDTVVFGDQRVPLARDRRPSAAGGRIVLGLRPEAFEDAAFATPGLPQLDVDVSVLEELGSDLHAIFSLDIPPVSTDDVLQAADSDDSLLVADRTLLTARIDLRSAARAGAPLRLALDPAAFHFFDPETGANVTGASVPLALRV
jgi:multiple sugar transport system ATP-binding protein